jgi:hypothetical protein
MWNEGWYGRVHVALIIILMLQAPAMIYVINKERKAWREFYAAHDCKKVGRMIGGTERTGWLCDDGITYWR